jgi:hypothetical protein
MVFLCYLIIFLHMKIFNLHKSINQIFQLIRIFIQLIKLIDSDPYNQLLKINLIIYTFLKKYFPIIYHVWITFLI